MLLAAETGWVDVLPASLIVAVVMIAAGLLTRSLADRGADGRLARNGVAGIRTRATRSSDEAWLAAHRVGLGPTRRGGEAFIVGAVLSVVPGPVMAVTGLGSPVGFLIWWLTVLFGGVVVGLWLVVAGAVRGDRAAKEIMG